MISSTCRGHEIVRVRGEWAFKDNMLSAFGESKRPCKTCGKEAIKLMCFIPDRNKWEEKYIDACIYPIVQALQTAGINMIASCCGHHVTDGWITLNDSRILALKKQNKTNNSTNDSSLVGASEGARVGPSVSRGIPGTNLRESRKGDL